MLRRIAELRRAMAFERKGFVDVVRFGRDLVGGIVINRPVPLISLYKPACECMCMHLANAHIPDVSELTNGHVASGNLKRISF